MLFDYNYFINQLKDDEEKKEVIEKYTRYYGTQDNIDIHETAFYKDYLSKFDIPFVIVVPEDLEDDFDWDLLGKLIIGSYSSKYNLVVEKRNPECQDETPLVSIYITVKSGDRKITKELSELWGFQIIRLYEIYIEEQMNLFILAAEETENAEKDGDDDEETMNEVKEQQNALLQLFKLKVRKIMKQPGLVRELEALL